MRLEIPDRPRPYVMAHRGNLDACPENTLAAFRRAIDEGADLLETDLHVTADDVFVCIHDATLDRTTDRTGAVAELTLAQVKAASASYGRPEFASERVPTLAELIAILPPQMILALELKSDRFLEPATARRLAAELRAAGMLDRTVVLSFHPARVQAVKAAEPAIPTGFITVRRLVPLPGVDLLGPFWPILFLNPFYVRMAHRRGQPVCPLDPTPDSRLWYYRLLRVDAVLTNNTGKTRQALGRS
jgi:glycerophosphoryl diester phosphodiesterase